MGAELRIAITAEGDTKGCEVDARFGRASYIIVYDDSTKRYEYLSNELNLNAVQGAGIQTASHVAAAHCEAVLTGHVGPKAFHALNSAGIRVYTNVSGSVERAVARFAAGELVAVDKADVEGHWSG